MLQDSIESLFHQLHELAEPGGQEERTSAFLAAFLRDAGYSVRDHVGGFGIVATLPGRAEHPCVAFLADMDALLYTISGKTTAIHACGHDANCAMLLDAARRMAGRSWPGTIKILFQPAEEIFRGALAMIQDHAADGIDILIGLHLRPEQEARLMQCTPSLLHSASRMLDVHIHGLAAHSARPHLGCNAIDAGAAAVNAINAVHLDPTHSYSAKVTRFHAGGASANIIPAEAELTVDLRADLEEDMEKLVADTERAIMCSTAANGARAEISTRSHAPAANNDPELRRLAEQAITDVLGPQNLLPPIRTAGGDDFHFFSRSVPGLRAAYLGLGADLKPGLHDPSMSFDTSALPRGADLLVRMAELTMPE